MRFSFPVKIYFVALILRLIPVFLTANLGIGLDDMFQYDMLARSLSSGHGFRWYVQEDLKLLAPYVDFDLSTAKGYDPQYGMYTSFRAPLYPAFLALVYSVSGLGFSRFFAARLTQAIFLGAPLAPLTYFVAQRFILISSDGEEEKRKIPESTARLSAWIAACYPMLLVYPLGLGTENLFFILLLFSFYFLLGSIQRQPSTFHVLLSGIFLALTALTRSVILPFAVFAFCLLYYYGRRKAFVFLAAFVLLIAPWMVRNSLLHHKLIGIETSMGYNLYLGYHPDGNGSFIFGPSLDLLVIMDDAERDSVGTQKALEFIRAEPGRILPLALNRLGFFFGLEKRVLMYFYSNNILGYIPLPGLLAASAILLLPFILLGTLSVAGFVSIEPSRQRALLGLLFLTYILPHVFILAEDRFHLALIPYFAILASYALVLIREKRWHWRNRQSAAVIALALVALLFLNWGLELHRDADKIAAILGPNGNQTHFPY